MKKDIKEKWVKALRSGEYKQGKYVLRSQADEYCCLGVLCDLFVKEHNLEWIPTDAKDPSERVQQYYALLGNGGILPFAVREWADFLYDHQAPVIRRNDTDISFAEIADYIEENF